MQRRPSSFDEQDVPPHDRSLFESATGTRATADWYRRYGWDISIESDRLLLRMSNDLAAVAVPAAWVPRMLAFIDAWDLRGPAINITRPVPRVVFLCEANGTVVADCDRPSDVTVLGAGKLLSLPTPGDADDPVRWLVNPQPDRRWMPSLAGLLAASWRCMPRSLVNQELMRLRLRD